MNTKIIPYNKLTIQDDFIFGKVFSDLKLLIPLLKRILPGVNVDGFKTVVSQKTVDEFYESHGIRIDVYGENGEFITAVEMHVNKRTMPVKRPRYYQSVLDMMQLNKGIFYDNLKQQYVIITCPPDGGFVPTTLLVLKYLYTHLQTDVMRMVWSLVTGQRKYSSTVHPSSGTSILSSSRLQTT